MSETTYRKVSVEKREPIRQGFYHVILSNKRNTGANYYWGGDKFWWDIADVEFWLEEVSSDNGREAQEFAEWVANEKWKFNGNQPKHHGYWIKFKGTGRGYSKETTPDLYQLFLQSKTK